MQMTGWSVADRKVALSTKEIKHIDIEMEVLSLAPLRFRTGFDRASCHESGGGNKPSTRFSLEQILVCPDPECTDRPAQGASRSCSWKQIAA